MKTFFKVSALLMAIILIPVSMSIYENCQVFSKGHLVDVTIIYVPPPSISSKGNGLMQFQMQDGKEYTINVGSNSCNDFHVGDKIKLLYLKGYEDRFLFPNDNPYYWSVICILLFIGMIIGSLYYGFGSYYDKK